MPTIFRLVALSDLDTTQAEFAFEESGGNTYLKLGLLSADNRRHFESVVAGGRVGFFESGIELSDSGAPNARILADYDAENGIQVDRVPSALRVGSDYEIKWTQARPGAPAEGADEVPLDVTLVRKIQIDGLEAHTLVFEYNIGSGGRPGQYWGPLWFGSIADLEAGTPELDSDQTPLNVSITPPELAETEGLHFFHLSFTPQFEGDHYLAFVLDPQDDARPQGGEPERPIVGIYLVDTDDTAIVDADGNFVIQEVDEEWNYLEDADGYQIVDADGFRVVEIVEV